MPIDSTGAFRHNHESAAMHSEAAGKKYNPDGDQGHEDSNGDQVEIHSHGDGTFHTMHQGEREEHETHGHALIHAAKVHAEEGHKHFIAHHDGETVHTHSVKGGEEPEHQEHDPANLESAKQHLDQFFDEEAGEKSHEGEEEPSGEGEGLGGLY
jgi:hypothetical protein